MSRSLRNGAIAALVLAIAPLSACAASNDAASLQVQPNNVATSLGDNLKLSNVLLITRGAGAAETETHPAAVSASISNTGSTAEVLRAVSVGDAGSARFTGPGGGTLSEITIPAGGSVLLGGPGQPRVQVADATVQEGGYSKVTFSFAPSGTVAAQAAVVSGRGEYAPFAPAAPASPATPATPAASPTGSPTGKASSRHSGATGSPAATGAAATGAGTATASPAGTAGATTNG